MIRILLILIVCALLVSIMLVVSKLMEKNDAKNKKAFLDDIEEVSKRVKDLK